MDQPIDVEKLGPLLIKQIQDKKYDKQIIQSYNRLPSKNIFPLKIADNEIPFYHDDTLNMIATKEQYQTKCEKFMSVITKITLHRDETTQELPVPKEFCLKNITNVIFNTNKTLCIASDIEKERNYIFLNNCIIYNPSSLKQAKINNIKQPSCIIPDSLDSYYYYNKGIVMHNMQDDIESTIDKSCDFYFYYPVHSMCCNKDGTIIALCSQQRICLFKKNESKQLKIMKEYVLFKKDECNYIVALALNRKGTLIVALEGYKKNHDRDFFENPYLYCIHLANDSYQQMVYTQAHGFRTPFMQFSLNDDKMIISSHDYYIAYDNTLEKVIKFRLSNCEIVGFNENNFIQANKHHSTPYCLKQTFDPKKARLDHFFNCLDKTHCSNDQIYTVDIITVCQKIDDQIPYEATQPILEVIDKIYSDSSTNLLLTEKTDKEEAPYQNKPTTEQKNQFLLTQRDSANNSSRSPNIEKLLHYLPSFIKNHPYISTIGLLAILSIVVNKAIRHVSMV
jgi:hypothetical protein